MRRIVGLSARSSLPVIGCLVTALVAGCLGIALAAAASTPRRHLEAITGSHDYLVYAEFHGLNGFVHPRYAVRDRHGNTWHLPDASTEAVGFSLAGRYLVELNQSGAPARWWNLVTHKHSRIAHPKLVVSAAPHGWLVQTSHRRLVEIEASGRHRFFTRVPHLATFLSETAGDFGLLLNDDRWAGFVSWAHPHRVRKLDPGLAAHEYLRCTNVDGSAAGCSALRNVDGGEGLAQRPVLLRLDGSAPLTQSSTGADNPVIVGHALSWLDSETGTYDSLRSSGTSMTSPGAFSNGPVAAYGHIVLNRGRHELVRITTTLKGPHTVASIS
jgi:hypothetical protein